MRQADIIINLESTSSRLEKEDIIFKEMSSDNVEFFEGVQLAYDKLITFGVNEKSIPKLTDDCIENTLTHSEFINSANSLIDRKITGNAAKDLILSMMKKCSSHAWNNWYRRILLKDLKCGVDVKTINKCARKLSISQKFELSAHCFVPVFSCQLAEDSKNFATKLSGLKILQEKLDGSRVITIVYPEGKVEQFSRNGKELLNFQHIKDQFSNICSSLTEPMVFDGEVMSKSFQALMSQLYRKTDVQTEDSVLYLFDCLPLDDFVGGVDYTPQRERLSILNDEFSFKNCSNIQVLNHIFVNLDTEEGLKEYNLFNKKCIDAGKEGIMIKDPDSPYECKRSHSWLKLKPELTVDLQIVDLQEGDDKYVGKLGAMVCNGFVDDVEIFVNVGSGFSDKDRELYWNNKIDVIGKIVEVKCDAITQNQNGTYSLRFPRFVRLRGFDINEKI